MRNKIKKQNGDDGKRFAMQLYDFGFIPIMGYFEQMSSTIDLC